MSESSETTEAIEATEVTSATSATTDPEDLRQDVIAALKSCYDPEIPVDIYELGLIYEVDIRPQELAYVKMTLPSPMCPVAEILPLEVQEKVRGVPGVSDCELDLVWDPPWEMDMMSESAKLELNF